MQKQHDTEIKRKFDAKRAANTTKEIDFVFVSQFGVLKWYAIYGVQKSTAVLIELMKTFAPQFVLFCFVLNADGLSVYRATD